MNKISLFSLVTIFCLIGCATKPKTPPKVFKSIKTALNKKNPSSFELEGMYKSNLIDIEEGSDYVMINGKKLRFENRRLTLKKTSQFEFLLLSYSGFSKKVIRPNLVIRNDQTNSMVKLKKSNVRAGYDYGGANLNRTVKTPKLEPGKYTLMFLSEPNTAKYSTSGKAYTGSGMALNTNISLKVVELGSIKIRFKKIKK